MLSVERLHLRAAFFRAIRNFFYHQGFLEVDTPLRQPVFIPESHILPFASENHYLQTSPELCMKRLLAQGCEKIFQISPCFRKGECGRLHLEEFQMLEWYRTGCDYFQLMTDCEMLVRFILEYLQHPEIPFHFPVTEDFMSGVHLSGNWPRLTVDQAFHRYSPYSLDQILTEERFDEILVEYVEPKLGYEFPVFLYEYPAQLASLAKKNKTNPKIAERFELYIKGVELANGFSELTDGAEQRQRFQAEIDAIRANNGYRAEMPERFLQDLDKLDVAAGIALGVDRLFMLALNCPSISSAVPFCREDFY